MWSTCCITSATNTRTIDSTPGRVTVRDLHSRAGSSLNLHLERDAFGCDEYHPVSGSGKNLTTNRGIGYMIIDSLDTMLMMGEPVRGEYLRARRWVETELDFDRNGRYSTFEVRVLHFHLLIY